MIKKKDGFLKHKKVISAFCLALIVLLAGIFLTAKRSHKIEIFVLEGMNHKESEYSEAIKKLKPVLTEKDMLGYRREGKMIFLKEEALQEYRKLAAEEDSKNLRIIEGGSVILGVRGPAYSFVIAVDDAPVMYGTVERPIAVSYIPPGAQIGDAEGGLRIYTCISYADEERKRKQEDAEEKLASAFQDMGLLTDEIFDFRRGKAVYKTAELYSYKTDYLGDNSKVSGILNRLPFPEGILLKGSSLGTEEKPYFVTVHLKRAKGAQTEAPSAHCEENMELYETNAQILLALVGNLEAVNFAFEGEREQLQFRVAKGDAEAEETDRKNVMKKGEGILVTTLKYNEEARDLLRFYKLFEGYLRTTFNTQEDIGIDIEEAAESTKKEKNIYPKSELIQVRNLLTRIASSPKSSSSTRDYIDQHPVEYYELLKLLSQNALNSKLEEQKFSGLAKSILEAARADLKARPLFFYATETGFVIRADGIEKRALLDQELEDVRRSFMVLRYDASSEEERVNPVSYLLTSIYERPEAIDLSKMLWYMRNRTLKDDAIDLDRTSKEYRYSDTAKFEALKKMDAFPFKTQTSLEELPVPVKEVFIEEVSMLLYNYMGKHLEELDGIGKEDALYVEEFGSFFNYSSDFGLVDFIPKSGELDGKELRVYGEDALITLSLDDAKGKWYLYSRTKH